MTAQVRINEGVLWVGGEAYPLRTISHVGQRRLTIDKPAASKKFIRWTIVLSIACAIFIAMAGTMGIIALIAGEAFLVWKLVSVLRLPAVYGLVINTAGTQSDAIFSTQREEILRLIEEITKAIGNPDVAQTVIHVAHAVQGDFIQQYGGGNIGTARHSGSGSIGGS